MDGQMQTRFFNHILRFFVQENGNREKVSDPPIQKDGIADVASSQGCADLTELVGLLRAGGFRIKYSDKSEVGGTTRGCRTIIICQRSGVRVVMDGEGPCTCPPEEAMNLYLASIKASAAGTACPPLSLAASPSPSTASTQEEPLTSIQEKVQQDQAVEGADQEPPKLERQKTWSRDDDAEMPENRRLSAPPAPVQSAWVTLDGDELNVVAAKDLLQEALSLLSGVKKVNLRNTPIRPAPRRQSAAAARRASSDAFVLPLRPLSRASSTSSGLASSRSTSSLHSTHSGQVDTPRPVKPNALSRSISTRSTTGSVGSTTGSTTLRRSASAAGSSARVAIPVRPKVDSGKKGSGESRSTNSPRTFLSKVPSLIKAPSASTNKTLQQSGIKTNSVCKPKSPEV